MRIGDRDACEAIRRDTKKPSPPRATTLRALGDRIVLRAILLSLLGPVAVSSVVPIYFGHTNFPYWTALIWALACTLWWAQPSFKAALRDTDWLQPAWYKSTVVAAVLAIFAFAFVLGDSLAYFLAARHPTGVLALSSPATAAAVEADRPWRETTLSSILPSWADPTQRFSQRRSEAGGE